MYKELNISETEGVLAAFNAVCDLKEETERLQAACAAREAELAGLRAQTAELFGARLEAEGADEDAVSAAKAMWQSDPQSVAMATLGCDFAEAANPYGCNQYGHEWRSPHGANWRARGRGVEKKNEKHPEQNNGNKAKPYNVAPKKEIHVDNPKYKPEVNEYLRNVKTVAQQEKDVYDSITKGKLSSTELQNKLKEWRELQNKYYEVLDDFKNKNVGVNVIEQNEVYHTEVKTEDDIMEHYEEISKRYPDKVHAANPYGCNQYGHGFREPHGAAGGRGQKTFDFFGETVDREREKANTSLEKSMKNFKEAYEERKKAEEEYNKSANWKEASEKWDRAEENFVKQAREARKQRAEIRKRYKNFELDESDDKLIDDILKGYDDDEVKSSRTLEEMLDADVFMLSCPL